MGNKEAVNERLAIRNARLVSALTEGYDGDQADLLIEDGRITGCLLYTSPSPRD